MSDLVTGAIGVTGALIGGGVTMGASYLDGRWKRKLAFMERDHHVQDVQRETAATFLRQADLFLDTARALAGVLEGSRSDVNKEELYSRYEDEWTELVTSNSALQVIGPPEVAVAAQTVRRVAGTWADVLDDRYKGHRWPADKQEKQEAAWDERRKFVLTAQRVFGPRLQ
ncbi:hypothetical protein [Micromonospora musae]|uniref:hypothetical protein n=1 Tax=Micromonospora musae TaxID=1894970 RepID=UPI0033C27A24